MKPYVVLSVMVLAGGLIYSAQTYHEFTSLRLLELRTQEEQLQAQLQEKSTEVKKLRAFAENIERVKQELRELNLQLEAALETMPRSFNLSALLRKITMVSQNSGVELSTFRPKSNAALPSGAFYQPIRVDFTIHGGFGQTLVFFDQISRLKRIVHIESLRMHPGTLNNASREVAGRSPQVGVTTEVTIRTYRATN